MPSIPFFIVDAFTRTRFLGNPAGVVLADPALTEAQMQVIAGELGLETVFATPGQGAGADYGAAYYTGTKRIPLCGHDTIALLTVLAQTGRIAAPAAIRLATDVGVLAVSVGEDGGVIMTQTLPAFGHTVSLAETAAALGLPVSEIIQTGLPVQVVSTGTPFLIVPLATRAALNALAPDMTALIRYSAALPEHVEGVYVWTKGRGSAVEIHARCFCPAAGLPEDPVTGSASGAVGAFLVRHGELTPDAEGVCQFQAAQGDAMGRPGRAEVRLETAAGEIVRVQVSGFAVIAAEGTLLV